MMTVLISVLIVAGIGLLLGALIGYTDQKFKVETDPRIDEVLELLPKANCGGCGKAGCGDMAKDMVEGEAEPNACPVCSADNAAAIAKLLGKETASPEKKVAVVFCSGTIEKAHRNAMYNGIQDCRSASMVGNGGGKACWYGCLGFGSCARACPFGAIEIRNGLAVVHPDVCRGCGKCESVCPRKLIRLVPASARVHVFCNSILKPQLRRKACANACISCKKCVKTAPDQFSSQGLMVRVNYSNPPDESILEKAKCPVGCLDTIDHHLAMTDLAGKQNTEVKK